MAQGDLLTFEEARAYMLDGDFASTNEIWVALVTNATVPAAGDAVPSMGGGTTNYTDCTAGGNYAAGGELMATYGACVTEAAGTMTFDDTGANVSWAQNAANPTDAYYAIVYNTTDATNRAIAFIDLNGGAAVDMTAGALTITWNASGLFTIAP